MSYDSTLPVQQLATKAHPTVKALALRPATDDVVANDLAQVIDPVSDRLLATEPLCGAPWSRHYQDKVILRGLEEVEIANVKAPVSQALKLAT